MAEITLPVHHNIYHVPQGVETFPAFPEEISNGMRYAFLTEGWNRDHRHYARGIVGSTELEGFYDGIRQAIKAHALEKEPQTFALIGEEGAAIGVLDKSYDKPLGFSFEQPKTTFLRFDMTSVKYPRFQYTPYITSNLSEDVALMSDPEITRINHGEWLLKAPLVSSRGGGFIESTTWRPEEGMIKVERELYAKIIAIGRTAVELLPLMACIKLANAYDQLLDLA